MRRHGIRQDMTPLVDVAFLLLIFFMSTTSFRPPEEVSVRLPLSRSEIRVPDTNRIIITVDRAGQVYISGESAVTAQQIPMADMFDAVAAWRGRNPEAVVLVKGDRDAPFATIADLMDVLAETKTLRFNLMTDPRASGADDEAGPGPRSAADSPPAPEGPPDPPPAPNTAPESSPAPEANG
ncbi:MAG: biopolymer transporter ExbD [Gemmatimonadetes bacterium]|nr:biopolymer transporter ExbD [Gemmatimonadota bacterium]